MLQILAFLFPVSIVFLVAQEKSTAYSRDMKNGKPLQQWQIDDIARLKALWEKRQETNKQSQGAFAAEFDIGTQGMFWQYMNGRTKLNIEAVSNFARGLGCSVYDISPTLAQMVADILPILGVPGLVTVQDGLEGQLLSFYRALSQAKLDELIVKANSIFK